MINQAIESIIRETAETAGMLWQNGWAERNAGNISVNISGIVPETVRNENPNHRFFLVTGSNKRMRDLAKAPRDNMAVLNVGPNRSDYRTVWLNGATGDFKPTSEWPTHLAIHDRLSERPDAPTAVIHTHPDELIALTHLKALQNESVLNRLLWSMHTETSMYVPKGLGYVPYILPGSRALARATCAKIDEHDIVLWEKHGTLTVGRSVAEAFDTIDIMSKAARIYLQVKGSGMEPEGLASGQVDEIRGAL